MSAEIKAPTWPEFRQREATGEELAEKGVSHKGHVVESSDDRGTFSMFVPFSGNPNDRTAFGKELRLLIEDGYRLMRVHEDSRGSL